MPEASHELHVRMAQYFGDPVDDRGPMDYLKGRGYKLTHKWEWERPLGLKPTEKDLEVIQFLIEEWDFGGLAR